MILGEQAPPESVDQLREKLGLNEPIIAQFTSFIVGIVVRGDTGTSLVYDVSTRDLIVERAPISLALVALTVVFSVILAVPLAMAAATHRDRFLDHSIRVLPTIGLGMPTFWTGLILIVIFAVGLQWFPVGGVGTGPGEPLRSLVLPALTVSLGLVPSLVRSLRAQLLDVLDADFVATLTAARVPRVRVLFRHVLRNAALPTLTLLGVNVAYLIGGTLVIERVFAINGLGTLLFSAISNRDFPVVQGIALYSAIVVVFVTLVVDILIDILDPRVRRS